MNIKIPFTNYNESEILLYSKKVKDLHNIIHNKTGEGSSFLGWLDFASKIDEEEIKSIENISKEIRENADVLVVIGIGGSYLGSKAIIDLFKSNYKKEGLEIIFSGNNISSKQMIEQIEYLKDKSVYVNVISKSGRTLETAISFRMIRKLMEEKYSEEELKKRIICTTDEFSGALFEIAEKNNFRRYIVPSDVGGRYSVITPVGLIPIAAAGYNIRDFIDGFKIGEKEYNNPNLIENEAYKYAVLRNLFYRDKKTIEILTIYEPSFFSLGQWFLQLFGESEGKNRKGIYPSLVQNTTDLHSLGQYIQDGERQIFETVLFEKNNDYKITVEFEKGNEDGLNYLNNKSMNEINKAAMYATALAHFDGGSETILLEIEKMDIFNAGKLCYFFMKSCAMSAYMMGVNPFNQPGVENYKKNMFALLGKEENKEEGEKIRKILESRSIFLSSNK